jgi:hypothetical protein
MGTRVHLASHFLVRFAVAKRSEFARPESAFSTLSRGGFFIACGAWLKPAFLGSNNWRLHLLEYWILRKIQVKI